MPPPHLLRERLDAVLAVVYLIFNEGFGGREELAAEAIWLGRALAELLPGDPEVHGLLAMMLLHDSRSEARFSDGELVLLGDQDRSLWNADQIASGRAELDRAIALGGRGPYVLQAAIASLHSEVPCDWAQIAELYGRLGLLTGSPVVELNRAIAVAEVEGPEAGLRIIDQLGLDDFRYLHSTRGELLRRLGRTDEAREAYRRARQLTDDGAERRFLERRLTELAGTIDPGLAAVGQGDASDSWCREPFVRVCRIRRETRRCASAEFSRGADAPAVWKGVSVGHRGFAGSGSGIVRGRDARVGALMAGGGDLAAAFRALAEDAAQAGENVGKSMSRFFEDTAEREDQSVATHLAAEEENTRAANSIRSDANPGSLGGSGEGTTPSSGSAGGRSELSKMLNGEEAGGSGGQAGSSAQGEEKKPLPDWLKKRWEDGERFNRDNHSRYPHNEVELATRKRVDSYKPDEEIVERKNTQLSEVKESTAKGYIDSLREKYKPGQLIADTPKNRAEGLAGTELVGDHILEVPPQANDIPRNILDHATDHDVTIRDTNGKEYN